MKHSCTRREFLATSSLMLLAAAAHGADAAPEPAAKPEPIIDIHQHTNYSFRTDEQLLAHQKAMGVTQTILLPAGSLYGLAANATGNEACRNFALDHPGEYFYFANEVTDLPGARAEIEKYLKMGAMGIGEQKFHVDCDSPSIELVAEIAQDYKVPVLMHFQHNTYNLQIERMHKTLEKFPKVNFIGHAQTWWGNIDKNHDPKAMYPIGKVTPGGITDRLLTDYPNMYGDLSAGSGLNALNRDKDFTRGFLERHQNKLLYGSDCNDAIGRGPGCQGARTIAAVRELATSKAIERKLLYENARKMFKL
jgi:uncharacterized protein